MKFHVGELVICLKCHEDFIVCALTHDTFPYLGSRVGAVVRTLAHQCSPGSITAQCHMRVSLLLVPTLLRGFFPDSPVFLPPQKPALQIPIRPG